MSQLQWIVLYGLALLYGSGAVPFRSNMPDEWIRNTTRKSKTAEIESFMNKTVSPCEDFYEFSCGNWPVLNKASKKKLATGLFEKLNEAREQKLKVLLNKVEVEFKYRSEVLIDRIVKDFYKSCMVVTEINSSIQERYKLIINDFGSMPVLHGDNWSEAGFDWVATVSKITYNYGLTILIGAEVTKDFANNKVNVVYISEQEFPLETRSMYLSNHTAVYRNSYQSMIASNLQKFLGVEKNLANITAKELMEFEVQLAQGLVSETEDLNLQELSQLTSLSEMQRLYAPDIDVERLVKMSLNERVENVYNYNSKYHENLIKVLRRTPKKVVANYIFYRLVDQFFFTPGKSQAEKEEKCTAETNKYFAKVLDNLLFRNYNTNATSNDVETIWTELKTVFKQMLQNDTSLNWINNQTRTSAIEKLDKMVLQINSYDLDELSKEFEELYMYEDNFILNKRQIKRNAAAENRDQLNKPVKPLDHELLSTSPANILMENIIKIPVALLQPNFLWADSYPNAIKFGTLASLIGHELIHGFDNDGRDFDAQGNVKSWWDDKSTSNFVERQNCFKQQYSNYSYNGKQLPESNEQSENIADNGGLRLGYAAYRRWLQAQQDSGNDLKLLETEQLPSFNYSNMQLFFISYAQLWCNDVLPEIRNLQVATDQHVPGKFRVIGPISNFEEFATEFKCQQGTPMNPIKKCKIY